MLKKCMALSVLLCFVAVITGCATIMHGPRQDVGISSSPAGAMVTIDGVTYGKTPVITNLKRNDNHIVKIELAGYEPYETTLTKKLDGWVWGNIVIGGLIGLAIDAISGSINRLTPEEIQATLAKNGGSASLLKDDMLCVAVVLKSDPNWEKIGELKRVQ